MVRLNNDWDEILNEEFQSEGYAKLRAFLLKEYKLGPVYPPARDIFNAFRATPFHKVRAVVLGQDPYHGPGQAHGMCFSVRPEVAIPPSLRNIHKELAREFGYPPPGHGYLGSWAEQGVLLLNTILTVRKGQPMSHANQGWEEITDAVIKKLAGRKEPLVFLLWGAPARKKQALIQSSHHLVLTTSHPSPLSASRGFLGSDCFKQANDFLKAQGQGEICWQIPEKAGDPEAFSHGAK